MKQNISGKLTHKELTLILYFEKNKSTVKNKTVNKVWSNWCYLALLVVDSLLNEIYLHYETNKIT